MEFILSSLLSYLLLYKYAVLFGVTYLAALALPIPAAATLIASAAFASQGYFSFTWVVITAITGNIFGDATAYWIVRLYGYKALYKLRWHKYLESGTFLAISGLFERHRPLILFFSRFEVIATVSVNIISALRGLSYPRFLLFTGPGEVAQVLAYASLGYLFGGSWQALSAFLGNVSILVVLLFFILIGLFWRKIAKRAIHSRISVE
ncbi:MAG TPA: VTT domain-containing protein [Patescibacteria group bacterium]|nr:VTT domain-containing protein [Patescibacteria group bacterium]